MFSLAKKLFYVGYICAIRSGADIGEGGRPPSRIQPLTDPKGPPLELLSDIQFWLTDPKFFLKAPLAPIYTYFKGERAPKKRDFLVKFFQKLPKNAFLACFLFQI